MTRKKSCGLAEALASVTDPRCQCKNLKHRLVEVLVIGFCGVCCGCQDLLDLEIFGKAKQKFFEEFLELPKGIPAHDTFHRVLQAVPPQGGYTSVHFVPAGSSCVPIITLRSRVFLRECGENPHGILGSRYSTMRRFDNAYGR